ncbi:MAG: hypothetical protein WCD72_01260 [Dehalococcoidia bacterium]
MAVMDGVWVVPLLLGTTCTNVRDDESPKKLIKANSISRVPMSGEPKIKVISETKKYITSQHESNSGFD